MKIEFDNNPEAFNKILGYSAGTVTIVDTAYSTSLVITPERIITDWPPEDISELTNAHIQQIALLEPEIVLLGTGSQLFFPDSDIISPLVSRQIGYEVMDTGAACRSFNFLLGEGREVIAALFMIKA